LKHYIRCYFEKYFTAENAELAESIKNLFLGVLRELCGELLDFFSNQTGPSLPKAALI